MNRWRVSVTTLVAVATAIRVWWADLATIFPDVFAVRGLPIPLGIIMQVISALALPAAIIWGLVYLVMLDRRLQHLASAHRARAATSSGVPELNRPLSQQEFDALARDVVANLPPVRPPTSN